MMTNCWFRVKVNVCRPRKWEIGLAFEHPVQPGNQPGGWMAQQKRLETTEAAGAAPALPPRTTSAATSTNTANQFTMSEVRKHASQDSAWIVVHGHVYDCTEYLKDHPGGADSILINAGTDCTEEFDAIHSDKAKELLDAYRIGDLVTAAGTEQQASHHLGLAPIGGPVAPVVALSNPREKVPCRLVAKTVLSREVRLFRFALPSSGQVLGLPVGKHIFVCATIDGKLCMRAYTPTSPVDEVGHFDLLVKVYFRNENPKFPDGGRMTQYLDSLPVGARVDVKGPRRVRRPGRLRDRRQAAHGGPPRHGRRRERDHADIPGDPGGAARPAGGPDGDAPRVRQPDGGRHPPARRAGPVGGRVP
jgi:nitrate reductase (NAD(P)H)